MGQIEGSGTHNDLHEEEIHSCSASGHAPLVGHRWAVILAGGDGTRLQPLTRLACGDNRPKQFCPLLGGETLLAHTRQRISRTIESDHVLFVLTRKHQPFYEEELRQVPGVQKVIQPHNQGTLPAILWSLLRLFHADENAVVAFFPSDHYFANEAAFISTVERSFDFADKKPDSVFLLGAGAERPETEYGWIEPKVTGKRTLEGEFTPVRRFWEKPPLATAKELLRQGCLWNTFVMIGRAGAFLDIIQQTAPTLFETFSAVLMRSEWKSEEQKMQFVYDSLAPSDFSREVLALSTERLLVASCGEIGWSDLGEPRRFIAALTENGTESPWSCSDTCTKCGLTLKQILTLSGHGDSSSLCGEQMTLTSA